MSELRSVSRRAVVMAATCMLGAALAARAFAAVDVVPTLRFADGTRFNVDATSIAIFVDSRPPQEYPHVMYRAPFNFEQAARAWADAHFHLDGNSVNTLRISLHEGDITEKLLPRTHGIKGLFTKDQAAEYQAQLALDIAIVDPNGRVLASASGKAWDNQTIQEGATEEDKRELWSGMIKTTFDNLDLEMQPQIRSALVQYVH